MTDSEFFRSVRMQMVDEDGKVLSQERLAPLIGRSTNSVRNYESGLPIRREVWVALAKAADQQGLTETAAEIRSRAGLAKGTPPARSSAPQAQEDPLAGILTDHERAEIARLTGEIAERVERIQKISAGKK